MWTNKKWLSSSAKHQVSELERRKLHESPASQLVIRALRWMLFLESFLSWQAPVSKALASSSNEFTCQNSRQLCFFELTPSLKRNPHSTADTFGHQPNVVRSLDHMFDRSFLRSQEPTPGANSVRPHVFLAFFTTRTRKPTSQGPPPLVTHLRSGS